MCLLCAVILYQITHHAYRLAVCGCVHCGHDKAIPKLFVLVTTADIDFLVRQDISILLHSGDRARVNAYDACDLRGDASNSSLMYAEWVAVGRDTVQIDGDHLESLVLVYRGSR